MSKIYIYMVIPFPESLRIRVTGLNLVQLDLGVLSKGNLSSLKLYDLLLNSFLRGVLVEISYKMLKVNLLSLNTKTDRKLGILIKKKKKKLALIVFFYKVDIINNFYFILFLLINILTIEPK